jgi:phosphoglucosamine mutase
MSKRFFGTDGVRGIANQDLTPEFALRLGQAAGRWLLANPSAGVPRAVIGRDTRRSGPMIGAALAAGLNSVGVDAHALGVAPTGAVSFLARTGGAGLGVVISASHNPAPDNGVKLIGQDGRKLSDEAEEAIETLLDEPLSSRPIGAAVGRLISDASPLAKYVEALCAILPERLDGMRLVVDAAHGAAYALGPEVLRRLGAEVVPIGTSPDGDNINEGHGATHPATLQRAMAEHGADFGIAFDGDADRAVFADNRGALVNGDRCMAIWSAHWRRHGRMSPAVVVGTVMSNTGFERYLESNGIRLERTQVGDKYVSKRMLELGAEVGGEQSGHIVFPEHGPTGDGLVTALELLRVLRRENRPAHELTESYANWPQLLVNVSLRERPVLDGNARFRAACERAEAMLDGHGRLNVRPSGTQPMVRVMAESESETLRDEAADLVVRTLVEEFGGSIYSRVDLTHALGD